MIPFFRKLRKTVLQRSSMHKYLFYAIGEILLVVIGILIALQVNNWNESKKDRLFEKKMLLEVKNAIRTDHQHYLQMRDRMEELKNSAIFFVDYIADGKQMHDSLFNKFFQLNRSMSIQTNEGPYSAIKAVGLDKITGDSLRNELIQFYDFTYSTYIGSLEHYDRNSVRDIDRLIGFLEDPYILKRDGQNIMAQDFDENILNDPQFHRILRSILFRTNSLIRTIDQFNPIMMDLINRIESETAS